MDVKELVARFPEIPADLHQEPLLARFARELDPWLRQAAKPSPCSQQHDAANHYYLKLIGPLSVYGYGLVSRDKTLASLEQLLGRLAADREAFQATLVPPQAAEREVRGPGCDG